MDDNALSSESCRFHLDYAYFHVVADTCLLLVILLAKSREFKGYLMSAHVFGMIAWIFDYGLFYLIQGKRTVDLIVDETDPSIEIADSTGPVENFLFFFWVRIIHSPMLKIEKTNNLLPHTSHSTTIWVHFYLSYGFALRMTFGITELQIRFEFSHSFINLSCFGLHRTFLQCK